MGSGCWEGWGGHSPDREEEAAEGSFLSIIHHFLQQEQRHGGQRPLSHQRCRGRARPAWTPDSEGLQLLRPWGSMGTRPGRQVSVPLPHLPVTL